MRIQYASLELCICKWLSQNPRAGDSANENISEGNAWIGIADSLEYRYQQDDQTWALKHFLRL